MGRPLAGRPFASCRSTVRWMCCLPDRQDRVWNLRVHPFLISGFPSGEVFRQRGEWMPLRSSASTPRGWTRVKSPCGITSRVSQIRSATKKSQAQHPFPRWRCRPGSAQFRRALRPESSVAIHLRSIPSWESPPFLALAKEIVVPRARHLPVSMKTV